MYNLLIALAAAAAAFGLGALAGQWVYGVVPALLVFPVIYFVLARRTGKQLEAVMKEAMEAIQARRIDEGRAILESAMPLGRWQFLVTQQIYAQLGTLEYIQRNFAKARPLLEKTWSRNWQSAGLLAALDMRDKKHDAAIERMEKASTFGRREPLYWALLAFILIDARKADQALLKLSEAQEALPDSAAIKELRSAVANDRLKRFRWAQVFGQGWYQFFPEHVPGATTARQQAAKLGYQRGGKTWPGPRR
ncbi:MAG: hypothetical protein H6739_03030 [Alphaproteobacteria bacterium]|nr:hypothetical protein [Alphaproteobacteria bacterium]